MKVRIEKGTANGTIVAPASKSMAHRMLICAAMCRGESKITGLSDCMDVSATIDCLNALGIKVNIDGNNATVFGEDLTKVTPNGTLCCRESGSTLRFLIPVALLSGKTTMFCGAKSLMQRPMGVYDNLCKQKGMDFIVDGETIAVKGPLKAGEYTVVGNVSSQFISGLLFALPVLKKESRIKILPPIESRSYIEMTRAAQKLFGIESVWEDEHTLYIPGGQTYKSANVAVEGDYSGAAFPDALNLFGGNVLVEGLNPESIQGDAVYKKYFQALNSGVPTVHIGDCPDLGPIFFAIAAAKNGGVFSGTKRLKIKESDRAQAMAEELKKFGTSVAVQEDKVVVYPASFHAPTEPLNSHNDHRIAMSLAVLLTMTGGEIEGAEAVEKSYPAFFEHLKSLGIGVTTYEI
ncbi:MAG: 3-phosphoshikimate 1-carboxyvinyltransferase [Clostridia bacterium]|nr:3-phosphoshikimate 1-carboxyvinyltransferase [Clostridia bacterium]